MLYADALENSLLDLGQIILANGRHCNIGDFTVVCLMGPILYRLGKASYTYIFGKSEPANNGLSAPLYARSSQLKEITALNVSIWVLAALRIQHNFVKNRLILNKILNF